MPGGGAAVADVPRTVPLQQDPLAGFVATSAPGQQGTVTLADGQPASVRLLRGYAAASGRECREVLVGASTLSRSSLFCQADGQWVAARPLLQGGGTGRP
jgi:17 kDa common-antigen outer membrane protein